MATRRTDLQTELLVELFGQQCRCGRPKKAREAFCKDCYYALPDQMRKALWLRMGKGYEEAYAAAVREMKGDDPHD